LVILTPTDIHYLICDLVYEATQKKNLLILQTFSDLFIDPFFPSDPALSTIHYPLSTIYCTIHYQEQHPSRSVCPLSRISRRRLAS
jgi:hypothetical protein